MTNDIAASKKFITSQRSVLSGMKNSVNFVPFVSPQQLQVSSSLYCCYSYNCFCYQTDKEDIVMLIAINEQWDAGISLLKNLSNSQISRLIISFPLDFSSPDIKEQISSLKSMMMLNEGKRNITLLVYDQNSLYHRESLPLASSMYIENADNLFALNSSELISVTSSVISMEDVDKVSISPIYHRCTKVLRLSSVSHELLLQCISIILRTVFDSSRSYVIHLNGKNASIKFIYYYQVQLGI